MRPFAGKKKATIEAKINKTIKKIDKLQVEIELLQKQLPTVVVE